MSPCVLDVDEDLRALRDPQRRAGDRAVVGEHPHGGVADALGHRRDPQREAVAVGELDDRGARSAAGSPEASRGSQRHLRTCCPPCSFSAAAGLARQGGAASVSHGSARILAVRHAARQRSPREPTRRRPRRRKSRPRVGVLRGRVDRPGPADGRAAGAHDPARRRPSRRPRPRRRPASSVEDRAAQPRRARAECSGRSWRSGAGTRRGHEGLAWPRLGEARRTPA